MTGFVGVPAGTVERPGTVEAGRVAGVDGPDGTDGLAPFGAGIGFAVVAPAAVAAAGLAGAAGLKAVTSGFGTGAASPANRSSSLPSIATFIKVIQIGSAALAPVSFSPSD
jgi:hypothetical protein